MNLELKRQEEQMISEKLNELYLDANNQPNYFSQNNEIIINAKGIWNILPIFECSKSEL